MEREKEIELEGKIVKSIEEAELKHLIFVFSNILLEFERRKEELKKLDKEVEKKIYEKLKKKEIPKNE